MNKKWFGASFILMFCICALAFTYDVNSETISREKITSTEVKSEQIDIGIELEKEIKEGESFTSSITIPIAKIEQIDNKIRAWAIDREDKFFSEIKDREQSLSKYAEAQFVIEPIVKQVKKDFLTYEFHVQYFIEDSFLETNYQYSDITSFVVHKKKEEFVNLQDVIQIPENEDENEFARFLQTIPDGKQKDQLQTMEIQSVDSLQWLLNDKNIEFLTGDSANKENKNEMDRVFVEYRKLEKHLTDSYKKQFIPKKKKKKPEQTKKKETNKKLVALTFDDGPDDEVTPKILETLDSYNIPGTFFMLARSVEKHPELAKEVAKQGHEIANHTETHINLNTVKRSRIDQEIVQSKKIIEKTTGVSPTLFRPPYGEYNNTVLELANKSQQKIIMWSVDTLDWQHKNKKKTIDIVMRDTKPQSIILMHDIHKTTADALPDLIEKLQKEGFEFVTTSELIEHLEPAANGVYYGR
ncbi:MAG TPA: polysaccharide deacetylase family protein [Pseudogracilibacillus sp.]|nr:polysaccharide deacetylase family protein [Pseudogracilibacillus sp.]